MKKILLSLILCAVGSAVFMSNQSGAAASGPGDRTGRVTPTNTCRGCHSGSTYGNVTVTQVVKDLMNNVVTAYTPGMIYTVTLTINSTAGTPAGYAFQWASVKLADNMTQAGTPTTAQANTSVNTLSGRKYVEQSARLATNIITFCGYGCKW
jgi:cytochrome c5